ncbi:hypothetical protein MTR67_015991 [Solanum verrucosum]|uniref:Uncharacterized protein n=1 Tax=Solanum verrucosum TaxID=315347 RepID=A0AAF0QG13_SOLVR|nr:hypothetical protein MTR67_015991 [Solanum verrucosum]
MAVATTATTHFTVLQQPQVLFAPKSRSSPDACSIYTRTFSFPSGKSRSNHHFQYHTKSKYGVLNCICCSTDSNSRRGLGPSDGNTNKGKNSVTARRQAKGTVRPQSKYFLLCNLSRNSLPRPMFKLKDQVDVSCFRKKNFSMTRTNFFIVRNLVENLDLPITLFFELGKVVLYHKTVHGLY